eukprot:3215204-Amphidinium_carterae.1
MRHSALVAMHETSKGGKVSVAGNSFQALTSAIAWESTACCRVATRNLTSGLSCFSTSKSCRWFKRRMTISRESRTCQAVGTRRSNQNRKHHGSATLRTYV